MMDDMIDDDDEDEDEDEEDENAGQEDGAEDEDDNDDEELDDEMIQDDAEPTSAFEDLEPSLSSSTPRPKKNDKALFRPPTAEEMDMLKREGEDRGSGFGFGLKASRPE